MKTVACIALLLAACAPPPPSPWTPVEDSHLAGVSFRDASNHGDEIWAIGQRLDQPASTVLYFDGATWSELPQPPVLADHIWASGATDVWLAGGTPLFHWDGTAWAAVDLSPVIGLPSTVTPDVWGTAPDDVWAIAEADHAASDPPTCTLSHLTHFDGASWTAIPPIVDPYCPDALDFGITMLAGCTGTSGDVWVSALHIYGTVAGRPIYRWNGTSWITEHAPGVGGEDGGIGSVACAASEVWVANENAQRQTWTVSHGRGDDWTAMPAPVRGLLATSPDGSAWAATESQIWRLDSTSATGTIEDGSELPELRAIVAPGPDRALVFGADGSVFTYLP